MTAHTSASGDDFQSEIKVHMRVMGMNAARVVQMLTW